MKIFQKMNTSGPGVCPICNTKDQKPVILVPILETQKGNICEAVQIHLDCIKLNYDKEKNILYQILT